MNTPKLTKTHPSFVLRSGLVAFAALGTLGAAACSAPDDSVDGAPGTGGTSASTGGTSTATGGGLNVPDGTGGSVSKPPAVIEETLPEGFTAETTNGGWRVLGPLADFEEPAENNCANVLRVIARDFVQAHIDFGQEKPSPYINGGLFTGMVESTIGENRKPVATVGYTPADVIENFADWYVTTDGVNDAYVMDIWLQPKPGVEGTYLFDSNNFFPLDDHNLHPEDVQVGNEPHNFLFTIEMHTAFEYKGGEIFNFRGDDDVWVFINGKLAVDIGGIHGPLEGNVNLDQQAAALGIEIGQVYDLDLFQAERNPGGSNFRIETSLDFQSCGIIPDVPR